MATTTAFPSLSVPAHEDTMEMSSPAHMPDDNDIDLDYGGEYEGGVHLGEDEQMALDGEQSWHLTTADASMDDDAQNVVQEAYMRDGSVPEDDELIDYDDEALDEAIQEDTIVEDIGQQQSSDASSDGHEELASKIDSTAAFQEHTSLEKPDPTATDQEKSTEHDTGEHTATHDPPAVNESVARPEPLEDHLAYEVNGKDVVEEHTETFDGPHEGTSFPAPITVDTSVTAAADAAATPTDTGLHPVTLFYEGLELPLFKSKSQQDGLLKDDNLASLSLAELLSSCRHRIVTKLGRNVPEEQDLILSFDQLGLILVENSRCTFQSSLHDILEVYILLHHNDGVHDVPPLSLTLTQQFKFSSNLAMLKSRAQSGEGVPQVLTQQTTDHDEPDYDHEELTGSAEVHAEASDQTRDAAEYEEGAAVEDHAYEEGGYQDDGNYEEEHDTTADAGEEYDGQNVETYDQEHFEQPVQGDEHVDYQAEDLSQDHSKPGSALYENNHGDQSFTSTQADGHPTEIEHGAQQDDLHAEHAHEGSSASSQTVQGDMTKNGNGESKTDAIDWDDDSDLTNGVPELEQEDYDSSNLPADHTAEEVDGAANEPESVSIAGETAEELEDIPPEPDSTLLVDVGEHNTHEDENNWLPAEISGAEVPAQEYEELAVDDTADLNEDVEQDNEQQNDGEAEEYPEIENEDQYAQADTFEEQQEGLPYDEEAEESDNTHDPLHGQEPDYDPGQYATGDVPPNDRDAAAQHSIQDHDIEEQLDPEDDLIFDDETTEQHEAKRKASQPEIAITVTESPHGKRSYDEHTETEDLFDNDDEEPDLKKLRSQ